MSCMNNSLVRSRIKARVESGSEIRVKLKSKSRDKVFNETISDSNCGLSKLATDS